MRFPARTRSPYWKATSVSRHSASRLSRKVGHLMRLLPIIGRRRVLTTAVGLVFAVLAVGCSAPPATSAQPDAGGHQVPACPPPAIQGRPPTSLPPTTPTTVTTLGQAY